MLNPIECFIETASIKPEYDLVPDIQEFLAAQDNIRIYDEPIILLSWTYSLEEILANDQKNGQNCKNICAVQVLLMEKYIKLNSSSSDGYQIFEVLQKKMRHILEFEQIFTQAANCSENFYYECNQSQLQNTAKLLYQLNICETQKPNIKSLIDLFAVSQQYKNDLKRQKNLLTDQGLLMYSYAQQLYWTAKLIEENNISIDEIIPIIIQLSQDIKPNPQNMLLLSQCTIQLLWAYLKIDKQQEFQQLCAQLENNNLNSIEVQTVMIIAKITDCQRCRDLQTAKLTIKNYFMKFLDIHLIISTREMTLIVIQLARQIETYPFATYVIQLYLEHRFVLIQKSTNQINIRKMVGDIKALIATIPSLCSLHDKQFNLTNMILTQAIFSLTETIFQISINLNKIEEIDISQYLTFLLSILPNLKPADEQLQIIVNAITQLKVSAALQQLSLYISLQYTDISEAKHNVFQSVLKDYKSSFPLVVLIFIQDFKRPNRKRDCILNQYRTLLEEAYKQIESYAVPFYCILEASIEVDHQDHLSILVDFILQHKLDINPQIFHVIVRLLQKIIKNEKQAKIDQLFTLLITKLQDPDNFASLPYLYSVAQVAQISVSQKLCQFYTYFITQTNLFTNSLSYIRHLIIETNLLQQHQYKDLSIQILIYFYDLSQFKDITDIGIIIQLILHIIDESKSEAIQSIMPYILQKILVVTLHQGLEQEVYKLLMISLRILDLFQLLMKDMLTFNQQLIKKILRRLFQDIKLLRYNQSLPLIMNYLEMTEHIEEVVEIIPQINLLLNQLISDEMLLPCIQIIYLKLLPLKSHIPPAKMQIFDQCISQLQAYI